MIRRWVTFVCVAALVVPLGGAASGDSEVVDGLGLRAHEPVVVRGAQILGLLGSRLAGADPDDISVHAWDGEAFRRIASQVDQRRDVVLAGCGSFGFLSGSDVYTTYDYDGQKTTGFDAEDELVFMLRDAGERAPAGELPDGAGERTELELTDPIGGESAFVYVVTGSTAPEAAPYTTYQSDDPDNSDDIGCNRDSGWNRSDTISTAGFQMHFDSRWGIDSFRVRTGDTPADPADETGFGPSIVDRWKGRAYSVTGGSGLGQTEWTWSQQSTMLGTIAGPVRVIRATNGAASGTNVVRTVTAYADTFQQEYVLHLHAMPPEGFYGFWDMDCDQGPMTFYNELNPQGVPVDGVPDPVGDVRDNFAYQYPFMFAPRTPLVVNPITYWEQISSPNGGWVAHWTQPKPVRGLTSGYYRDDHDFNDGTGTKPGPGSEQGSCGSHGLHAHLADQSDAPGPVGAMGPSHALQNIIRTDHQVLDHKAPNLGDQYTEQQLNPIRVSATDQ